MLNKAVYQRKRKSKVRDSILLFGSNIFSLSHAREKKKKFNFVFLYSKTEYNSYQLSLLVT